MSFKGQNGIRLGHAASVVAEADIAEAAVANDDIDACGTSVQGVFRQLFDDGSWAFHNFAGCYLVGNIFTQYANVAHLFHSFLI